MKLPNIIDDLELIFHKANVHNETMITKPLIDQWLMNQRALWLSNEFNKGREIRNNETQTLFSVEMELDKTSSIVFQLPGGITLLKSKKKLPRTLQFQTRDGLIAIRPLNKQFPRYNYVSREQAPFSGNGKYNSNMVFFFKSDDYLYAKYAEDNLKVNIPIRLMVEGIFENPHEVDTFNDTIDNIWDGIDDYPISMRFIEYIKGAILETDFSKLIVMPTDTNNNDQNDIANGTSGG